MSLDLSRVAALAQLTLTAEETAFLPQELTALKAELERLPAAAEETTRQTPPAALRPDEVQPSLCQAAALQNAEEARNGYILLRSNKK